MMETLIFIGDIVSLRSSLNELTTDGDFVE